MRPRFRDILRSRPLAVLALALASSPGSLAQTSAYRGYDPGEPGRGVNKLPDALQGVTEVSERRGESVPLDALVIDSDGRRATLGEYFDGEKPVLLNLVYFECPLLCTMVMSDTARALRDARWKVGEDFTVLTISFDHTNTIADAAGKKAEYAGAVRRAGAMEGWKFFVTTEEDARRIADSVGFPYRRLPNGEYAHPSAQMVLTPEGKVSTYLYGLYDKAAAGASFTKQQLDLSLQDAAGGRLGGIFDQILMSCYVHREGRYFLSPMGVMRVVGLAGVVLLSTLIVALFVRERRQRARRAAAAPVPGHAPATV